jgi:hypothetical protein
MGQTLPLCGQLGPTRSCQDESKEVGEVGSKRTSSRCKEVHVVRCIGLVFRLLLLLADRAVGRVYLHDMGPTLPKAVPELARSTMWM